MSGSYERMNYITSFGFSIHWRKQFVSKLGKSNERLKVIDLLSGLGENWTFLQKNFPNADFYALDFSEQMINNSMTKANKLFKGKLTISCEDILNNQLPENHFDAVCCAFGLKTFNEEQLNILAKELHRILKPNGKFSFIEVSKPKNKILLGIYGFYLGKAIPVLEKLFLGNPQDYKMLWVYTKKFDNISKVKKIFEYRNLSTNQNNYFFGCATGISGVKTLF